MAFGFFFPLNNNLLRTEQKNFVACYREKYHQLHYRSEKRSLASLERLQKKEEIIARELSDL